MFNFLRNKEAEKVASEINKIHNKIFKLSKKNTNGSYTISKKIIEKAFISKKLKTTKNGTEWNITKKEVKWAMFAGIVVIHYEMSSKNKDEFKASYSATSTFPGYYFSIFTSDLDKKDKYVKNLPFGENSNGTAVKDTLIKKYNFKEF